MRQLPDGYTARFRHERLYGYDLRYRKFSSDPRLLQHGGLTICRVYNENGDLFLTSLAVCRKDEIIDGKFVPGDQYSKRIGRDVSLGRAIKAIETGIGSKHVTLEAAAFQT